MANTQSPVNQKLQGKVVIVTGGASGIGEAIVRLFAAHGARAVVIADIQDEKARKVAESIGRSCSFFHCDVTDEEQVKAMVDWTAQTHGGLDVMISNAGDIRKENQTILDLDFSGFDYIMKVNARGQVASVSHAARKMVELGGGGAIVCTASAVTTTSGALNVVDYTMSKHAVVGLVEVAGPTLGPHGIRINAVSPSLVPTPLAAKIGVYSYEDAERIEGPYRSLKGVLLTPERVAESVLFLASDEAAYITGRNFALDAGLGVHLS